MAKFQFRLSMLQRLRQQVRKQCQLDVAEAEAAWHTVVEEQTLLESRFAGLQAGMRANRSPGPVDLHRLTSAGDFADRLQAQLAQLSQRRAQLEDEMARRREALVEADRELKPLEKLRERQHQQHEMAARREDQKLQDDTAARQVERGSHR